MGHRIVPKKAVMCLFSARINSGGTMFTVTTVTNLSQWVVAKWSTTLLFSSPSSFPFSISSFLSLGSQHKVDIPMPEVSALGIIKLSFK